MCPVPFGAFQKGLTLPYLTKFIDFVYFIYLLCWIYIFCVSLLLLFCVGVIITL